MAKAAAAAKKPRTKSQIITDIAEATDLTRKQVSSVFEAMASLMKKDLSKRGPEVFVVPGLMKVTVRNKPATKAGMRPNPFAPGEMMQVKAKPASRIARIRAMKALKEML
ncbi:MAG TPA: HU family DNA-binding protein [Phycisphaerales bacterium]|nr:HU family DNA-binding protein [Phycisphaerales bacterium]HMP37864.1 HU family DNA-binding protein [Phycisphaerales bacterium]